MRWIWVSMPHATFGLGVREGYVVDAAPIARWAVGKSERWVAAYYRKKHAQIVPLN